MAKWVCQTTLHDERDSAPRLGEQNLQKELIMNQAKIAAIDALEILDSRGSPTLQVTVALQNGVAATASVPSGASTGENEAHELRDHDDARFGGRGVLRAAANVRDIIAPALCGREVFGQADIDRAMIELDGTANKHRLGANAILGVSMAVARAAAIASGLPLYRHLNGADAAGLPMPMMNIINGGQARWRMASRSRNS